MNLNLQLGVSQNMTQIFAKKNSLKFIENILTIDPIVHQNHINSYENEIDELLLFVLKFTNTYFVEAAHHEKRIPNFQECSINFFFIKTNWTRLGNLIRENL